MEPIIFKQWSNKKYAVLRSFHKIIHIGTLAVCSSLLQLQPVLAQSDTASPMLFYDLEEVESFGEQDAELYSPLLRQLLIIQQDQLDVVSSRSLDDLFDYYPGIDIRTRGAKGIQSDLSIQGGSFDQSLVMLNGVDMTDPQTGHFSMDLPIGPMQTDKVEILKGPASKKYGLSAYTGAVNIITQPADSVSFSGEASFGQFNTRTSSAVLNVPFGIFKTMLSASSAKSDGYTENTDFISNGVYLHSKAENSALKSDLIIGINSKSFGANAFYTPRFPEQFEETGSWLSILKFETKNSPVTATGQIHWKRHSDHFLLFRSNPSAYENYHLTDVAGGAFGAKISTLAGISSLDVKYRHEQIFSTVLGEATDTPKKIKKSEDGYYTHTAFRDHVTISAGHLAQIRALYLSAGVMFHAGIKDLIAPGIYPGIDISITPGKNFSLFASANRSMRLPTFTDLYYEGPVNRGNSNLKPEKAVTFETGARFTDEIIRSDVSAFYRMGRETIDWIWKDNTWETANITDLNTYGFETSIAVLPGKTIDGLQFINSLQIAYNFTELSKSEDQFISNYALDNLKHKLIFNLNIQLPFNVFIDGKLRWQDRNGAYQFYETPESGPIEMPYDPSWIMDINTGIKLSKITIFLDVTNLFKTSYRDIGSVVMPGRWLMIGIRYR